jgi:hypothetical protein
MSPSEPLGTDGTILALITALIDLSTSKSEKAGTDGGNKCRQFETRLNLYSKVVGLKDT